MFTCWTKHIYMHANHGTHVSNLLMSCLIQRTYDPVNLSLDLVVVILSLFAHFLLANKHNHNTPQPLQTAWNVQIEHFWRYKAMFSNSSPLKTWSEIWCRRLINYGSQNTGYVKILEPILMRRYWIISPPMNYVMPGLPSLNTFYCYVTLSLKFEIKWLFAMFIE